MSVERCSVPNCNNSATTGIPFPKESELLEKWLKCLDLPDFVPNKNSFVCLHHFGDDILEHVADPNLENILEELPIPVKVENSRTVAETGNHDVEYEENSTQSTICRLCMGDKLEKNIFDKVEEDIIVSDLITCCIPQIEISEHDSLSKWICKKCFDMLQLFYNFQEACIKVDQKQKELIVNQTAKRKINREFNISTKKICLNQKSDTSLATGSNILNQSIVDKKIDQVEAELMRVIEGKIPEEMRSADNIIIEVQSDDENEQSSDMERIISNDNVLRVGSDEVRLPKGIRVSVNQNQTKICNVEDVQGTQHADFCLVDNYLFEYRLMKGSTRHLRCLVPRCKATAQQAMTKPGVFENKVLVKASHNHPVPSEDERKKQIFLHLMRRRMQSDKTLNFKSVYEEFCAKDPEIKRLVPLKTVINQICCQQMNMKSPPIYSFDQFFESIETDEFQKLHFTHSNAQFYQEKFEAADGSKAIVFANRDTIERISESKIMYVDASFKIDTLEHFRYHLVSVLVWITDSYYPIMFSLINEKSQDIYKLIFHYLHNTLAPKLRPEEIVTDYEANLYYSLGEVYLDSHIGGSVFYYTQNLYKKICSLNLSRELETNSCFRNIYHMILMLPLLPVNTILDGLNNIELQAQEMGQHELAGPIFEYVKSEWISKVTPDLFCVHRLENRINENVIAPFKKLRDFIMLSKGKTHKQQINIASVVEKLIELEGFLSLVYSAPSKKSFARDLSSSQKKNVIRAWQFIESHPKININNFFTKVLGYIKCMENQLWIWGFYRYTGAANEELINAENFSIVNSNDDDHNYDQPHYVNYAYPGDEVVVDVMIDQKDGFLVKEGVEVQEQVEIETQDGLQASYIQ